MIPKPNSAQLMDEFHQMQQDIANIKFDLEDMEEKIDTKLQIINMYHNIAQNTAIQLQNNSRADNRIYFSLDADNKIVGGAYDLYGQTIHAPFKAIPEQMFNFITENGPLFKDCASVYLLTDDDAWNQENGYKYEYCDILKHEADTSKSDVYHAFKDEYVTLRVQLNHTNFYGNTACNMIEICPYFPGTFDINSIDIYSVTQYLAEGDDMDIPDVEQGSTSLTNLQDSTKPYMKNVGACRFMLPDTYQIYRIDFNIRIHKQEETYPFGLRHLYFYNAKIDTVNDYIIAAIHYDDNYIESVGKHIVVSTPVGEPTEALADRYGIEYYVAYDNGILQNQITATDIISRNLKTVYVKIPLHDCYTYIDFKDITLR